MERGPKKNLQKTSRNSGGARVCGLCRKKHIDKEGGWVDGADVLEAKKKGSFCLPFVGAKDAGQPGCCGEGSKKF